MTKTGLVIVTISRQSLWNMGDRKGMQAIYLAQKGLVDAGHSAYFLCSGSTSRCFNYEGITVRQFRITCPSFSPSRYVLHRLSNKLYWAVFVARGIYECLKLAAKIKPDVVLGYSSYGIPVAFVLGKIRQIPTVGRLFGTFLFPALKSRALLLMKFEELLAFKVPCDRLIITNDGTKGDTVAAALGVPLSRIRFWRNGIVPVENEQSQTHWRAESLALAGVPVESEVILWVSRLVTWKRVDRLIRAAPQIFSQRPRAVILIIGDGDQRVFLESLARQLGVDTRVKFLGALQHEEVSRFLNSADVFVSLFDYSNISNALLEAMARGRCVIALRTGDTETVVYNYNTGVLIDVEHLGRLGDTIGMLLANDGLRRSLGEAGRVSVRKECLTWRERIAAEVALIEEVAARKPIAGFQTPNIAQETASEQAGSSRAIEARVRD